MPPPEASAVNDVGMALQSSPSAPTSASSHPRSPFPPIADYGFLSDCENTCLISSAGSVEWLCAPRPDSPSFFGAILDLSLIHI